MLKLFVGCAANGEDAESQLVLEHSFRRHCSDKIDITWMRLTRNQESPFSGWDTSEWATPFSGFRWAVPELCGYEGRALYVDSDVIAKADPIELWRTPIDIGKAVIAKGGNHNWRFCVSLWDCSFARKYLPTIQEMKSDPQSHKKLIAFFKDSNLVQPFSNGNWNCVDGENYSSINDADIKILHYSSEAHQPQLRYAVKRLAEKGMKHWFDGEIKRHWRPEIEALFDYELQSGIKEGYKIESYEPSFIYGDYVKKSQKNYRSHQWAR